MDTLKPPQSPPSTLTSDSWSEHILQWQRRLLFLLSLFLVYVVVVVYLPTGCANLGALNSRPLDIWTRQKVGVVNRQTDTRLAVCYCLKKCARIWAYLVKTLGFLFGFALNNKKPKNVILSSNFSTESRH